MLDDSVSGHLEQMAEFSENWRKQVSPVLESVEQHSKGLAAQVGGLQPLIQKFSESLFAANDEVSELNQIDKNKEKSANPKTAALQDEEEPTNNQASNQ